MKKRLIAAILVLAMLIALGVPAFAIGPEDLNTDSVAEALNTVSNSINNLKLDDTVGTLQKTLNGFLSFASKAAPVFTCVNGSITFMKLVGIIEDTTEKTVLDIRDKLEVIDERTTEMSDNINDIAGEMVKLEAITEFNARGEKARDMNEAWKNYNRDYMENGLDSLMTSFNAMSFNAMSQWCEKLASAESESIVVLYKETENGWAQAFSDDTEVPSEYLDGGRYVVLNRTCLPDSIKWNAEDAHDKLTSQIAENVFNAVKSGDAEAIVSGNYPELAPEYAQSFTAEDADKLAADAVNALIYRVTAKEMNRDASFAMKVRDAFLNYCKHLCENANGVDAMLKSTYLTHAFEFEAKQQLKDFLDGMIVTTGTYGMFVANVLGMSNAISNAEKDTVMGKFCDAVSQLDSALKTCVTGYNNFCYITNTLVYYEDAAVVGKITADVNIDDSGWVTTETYKSASKPQIYNDIYAAGSISNSPLIGDSNALLLFYTIESNGIDSDLHTYLRNNISTGGAVNYGQILTSYNGQQTLPADASVCLNSYKVIGDWFSNKTNTHLNELPKDAKNEKLIYRTKATGSVYDYATGEISKNKTVLAVAAYAESRSYWYCDEVCLFAGPSDYSNFKCSFNITSRHVDDITYGLEAKSNYNVLVKVNVPSLGASADDGYNPIQSYIDLSEELGSRGNPFIDVSDDSVYHDAVLWAYYNTPEAITRGYTNNSFMPDNVCTRAQAVTFLWRAAGCPEPISNKSPFDDVVDAGGLHAYYKAILWAAEENITNGVYEHHFAPNDRVTRAQFVTFLWRYADKPDTNGDLSAFTDASQIASPYVDAVKWAVEQNIAAGYKDKSFRPNENCSRAAAVLLMYRAMA